ncbi:hypothetical protein BdWA1_002268 [Babesia duncani]|uniref:Uncharacterized protein n=1 Tax=Babesia duncani TaxID=323732 RepID=A0AAD9PJ79_9APIC|nr:hypothetical protein BdWA1_002268 [Babesia duncani]
MYGNSCCGNPKQRGCYNKVRDKLKDCPCIACNLKKAIEQIKGSGEDSKCCDSSSCTCSSDSDSNCCTKDAVFKAFNTFCKCKESKRDIKNTINYLFKECKDKTCCDVIEEKIKDVIEGKCTCKENKCCFKTITADTLSQGNYSKEQEKLKKIGRKIFKYFKPPPAYTTGLITLVSSETEINLCSSSSQTEICVEEGSLKIPKEALKISSHRQKYVRA